jgi:dolichyl-phosphate beta-glucosyltransferase
MHHSIIIPAYNEAARILPYLRRIVEYMRGRGGPFEVLVVDDGSIDATSSIVSDLATSVPEIRLLRIPDRRGKGAAVRRGMQAAAGQLQLFADADGATPIEELPRLEQAIEQGADLAIGSRALASRLPEFSVHARLYRTVLGSLFNMAVRQGGIQNIADTQCGFKLFRRSVAQDLFSVATIDGYGLDLELLYVAQGRRYRVAEVPINWTDQPGSKVRVWRDGFLMMRELARVRQNDRKGLYRTPSIVDLAPDHPPRFGLPLN